MPSTEKTEALRRRLENVPRRVQRTIDRYRVARGMTPLWASVVKQDRTRA